MKIRFLTFFLLFLFSGFIFACGDDNNSGSSNDGSVSTISYTVQGNADNSYIGDQIIFTRSTFDYKADDEDNAISSPITLPDGNSYQDIIGTAADDYNNSIYIRIDSDSPGIYSLDGESGNTALFLKIKTPDGKTFMSDSDENGKIISVSISESTENLLVGSFTATLNVYIEESGALYYSQELSELGQFYVNGEFSLKKM